MVRLTGFRGTVADRPDRRHAAGAGRSSTVRRADLTARFDAARPGALTGYRVRVPVDRRGPLVIRTLLPGEPRSCRGRRLRLAARRARRGARRAAGPRTAGPGRRPAADRPTADLLAAPPGPALVERLFDAGRYTIVSSTGELPPTLQGVWSGTWTPPGPAATRSTATCRPPSPHCYPTGTPELLLPVFDLLDSVRDDLRRNARRLYGAPRRARPRCTCRTHGRQNHFGPVWCLTFWTAGAAWLRRLYVDYWRYTGDRGFLRARALAVPARGRRVPSSTSPQIRDGARPVQPVLLPRERPGEHRLAGLRRRHHGHARPSRDLLTRPAPDHVELGIDRPGRAPLAGTAGRPAALPGGGRHAGRMVPPAA